jgi:hypothetical protein
MIAAAAVDRGATDAAGESCNDAIDMPGSRIRLDTRSSARRVASLSCADTREATKIPWLVRRPR